VTEKVVERIRGRRPTVLWLVAATLAVLAGATGLLALRGGVQELSSEWPRPYDPAKPFNMLGVPGVSVEQRKRAEDLLVRSLAEAPRWGDYQRLLDDGWYSLKDQELGFEHIVLPSNFADGRMLDPRYPESLVYKVKGAERIFVAYMYIAEPGITPEDPRIEGYAGRLLEWHNHSDVCWKFDEKEPVGGVAGFKLPDGSCPVDGTGDAALDPRFFTGETDANSLVNFGSFLMTHVWVVERRCGPFSALEGPSRGVTSRPLKERVDICQHRLPGASDRTDTP